MTKKGKFIVLEGGDGAGKSTIADSLRSAFPKTLMTRAGGSMFGEKLRELLVSDDSISATSESHFFLSWAMHLDHAQNIVAPALAKGVNVISDRFDASNFAYQVRGDDAPHLAHLFWNIRKQLLKDIAPDLYIFLDVDIKEGFERAKKESRTLDHFERRPVDFHERIREGYTEFFKTVPHVIVDANRPLEEVQKEVLELVKKCLQF
ncbi:MAG: dTMP kinase [bacterium]|nr:dTMP kinase [bacterium]